VFLPLLYRLRAQGVPAGPHELLSLLRVLRDGHITDVDSLYRVGRAILCRTEADFDAWDIAFGETFGEAVFDEETKARLAKWLEEARQRLEGQAPVDPGMSDQELWEQLMDRLRTQTEEHHGGNHWIGTGGTSPFGHSGRASKGIRMGGQGGGRGAIAVAGDRQWQSYRTDTTLDHRDLQVALKALRKLVREGRYELDLDETIDTTAKEAGEITLVERPERHNQVRLVLLMDAGGSMAPHAQRVEQLFTAAEELHTFRSFEAYFFHNCVYDKVWRSFETGEKVATPELIRELTPQHRMILVGDASMAPWELFHSVGWGTGREALTPGLEWLRLLRKACPASVWLNPDPKRWWDHTTVQAIGQVFPMFELTVDGLREAVRALRKPV